MSKYSPPTKKRDFPAIKQFEWEVCYSCGKQSHIKNRVRVFLYNFEGHHTDVVCFICLDCYNSDTLHK